MEEDEEGGEGEVEEEEDDEVGYLIIHLLHQLYLRYSNVAFRVTLV